ncbi:Rho-related GTP-binding protein RhoN [Tupaia chinensis]|uniref:Rho-related GTP-binding protein RhoN n=1 Tax=Tupaia chinensis TaxID=246437 RepID=L9JWE4_TUPCH|nr:Rho-related GTP-binding protein RhoN [Tupaia chinensis]
MMSPPTGGARCKIVVVGDAECGKTALLQVFAKDAYPGSYVPTVFENYTASFEIDKRRIELNMWDTSGSSYYDNVRPLAYPDSDAVLICFDISRPETLDSVLKKWQGETQEFCPNAKVVLVGCKLDMRTDLATLRELSKQRLIPVTHEQLTDAMPLAELQAKPNVLLFQGTVLAKQVGAVSYVECSSRSSERSVRDVFHVATVASLGRGHRQLRRTDSRRGLQRSAQLSGRPDRGTEGEIHKDRAKSCNLM